jgi:hypothetical protein
VICTSTGAELSQKECLRNGASAELTGAERVPGSPRSGVWFVAAAPESAARLIKQAGLSNPSTASRPRPPYVLALRQPSRTILPTPPHTCQSHPKLHQRERWLFKFRSKANNAVSSTRIEHVENRVVYCATGTEIYISAG